ncbi:baseplate J/gp47 family protein [Rhizobium sp. RU36D]|uniref:baseplate J/gp47 family protein n=1 Tax=Rhizobium sp. RU36D TaxID=1907415 RepID=UPI0009D8EAFB|nr:baseplate J/gp47 family protein [Rhizobium sp. RU36D]SMD18118.1 Phage-related baseplate assembly protein [Rhizobium sp. RU36D]
MFDLTTLPPPRVITEVSYEAITARQNAAFQSEWAALRQTYPDLPDYDVTMLETDPFVVVNQAESYREANLLSAINDAARARLLAFAFESDLDQLAIFYDVTRLPGETDARLKLRVILAIQGRSTGGPKERYKSIAMGADLRVDSVEVYRVGRSPLIHVAVFSTEPNGAASTDLLNIVRSALMDEAVQLVNDEFVVSSAVLSVVNIAADIWLLPDADEGTVSRSAQALRAAWALEQALGRDLVREWWVSKLMIAGVHKVAPTAPSADSIAPPAEALAIGTITLTLKGRAY